MEHFSWPSTLHHLSPSLSARFGSVYRVSLILLFPLPSPLPSLPLKPLLLMPFPFPPPKKRRLLQRPHLLLPLHHPLPFLLPRHFLQQRQGHMLHMPRILILHQLPLSPLQNSGNQPRHTRLIPKLLNLCKQRLEVEYDGAGNREATEGLPVDAEVDAVGFVLEEGRLGEAEGFVRVAGGHEEGGVDFETPGATLDWAGGGEFGEETRDVLVGVREREREEGGEEGVGSPTRLPTQTYRSIDIAIFSL